MSLDDALKKGEKEIKHLSNNLLLLQQYREKIISQIFSNYLCLLMAKQNNEFLMKNHKIKLVMFILRSEWSNIHETKLVMLHSHK